MNKKRFAEAISMVDDKYYEEVANYQCKKKKTMRVKWTIWAACVCFVAVGILAALHTQKMPVVPPSEPVGTDKTPNVSDSTNTFDPRDVEYSDFSLDWQYYSDTQSLVEKSNCAVLGTVTDISFQLLDSRTASPVTEETDGFYINLYTIYEVAVIKQYEGDATNGTIQVRVPGGIKGKYLEEQWNVLNGDARVENSIPCMGGIPEINIGETYLFLLWQYMDIAPTILNPTQSVYRVDSFSGKSEPLREIISCFGESEWSEFQEIIHSFE